MHSASVLLTFVFRMLPMTNEISRITKKDMVLGGFHIPAEVRGLCVCVCVCVVCVCDLVACRKVRGFFFLLFLITFSFNFFCFMYWPCAPNGNKWPRKEHFIVILLIKLSFFGPFSEPDVRRN